MTVARRLAFVLAASVLVAGARANAAPSKVECISAFDRAQQARREGALLRAHEDLLLCSQQECPAVVRADCAGVLRQVDAAQPTIVLKAVDARGNDLRDVSVELNGKSLATSLDGRAVSVDPGRLALVFRRPPWDPVKVDIVLAEAEKNRIVRAELGPPLPPAPPSGRGILEAPPPKRSVVGWVVPGGLALVGVAGLTFAGLSRLSLGSDADALERECAPTCSGAKTQPLHDRLATTNVALVIGAGTLALAVISWFVLAPKERARVASILR